MLNLRRNKCSLLFGKQEQCCNERARLFFLTARLAYTRNNYT